MVPNRTRQISTQNPMFSKKAGRLSIGSILRLSVATFAVVSASMADNGSYVGVSIPELLKVGRPAGSYALSDFDTVNLYNGNMTIHLPLLDIKGRGAAGTR